MFTGIVEEVGILTETSDFADFRTIRFQTGRLLEDIQTGSSIAVNGVCLTVRSFDENTFAADLSRETLDRTTLGALRTGSRVNLERPMRADGRFGGHLVQGHVDGLGRIRSFDRAGDDWNLEIDFAETAQRYVVEKGSIAVDGI